MKKGFFIILVSAIFFVSGLNIKGKKQCCDLGTNFSSNGQECKTFKPELAAELAGDKQCLNMVDVCCKKRYRELQCDKGLEDAKNTASCPAQDGDRKDCCESCVAGLDSGKLNENCEEGMGLGPPYDGAFTKCCKDIKLTTTEVTSTTTVGTREKTTTTRAEKSAVEPDSNSLFYNTANENICDSDVCAQLCDPVGDTFKCDCFKGFSLMEDGVSCKPVKRKKGGRCEMYNPCDHDCTDTGTAIKCSCRDGYELADDKRTCQDIDECKLNLHSCASDSDCINEIGSYSCYELPDYSGPDIFDSKCPPGYKYNFEKEQCDDIDECQFDLMCIAPKTCKNTIGSFICEGDDTPKCPPGFYFKPSIQTCTDIDECLTGENNCNKESQLCLNTVGNYTCVDKASRKTCPPGFKKDQQTQECTDIDECEEDNICGELEQCVNEPGGHSCVPIKSTIGTTSTSTTEAHKVCPKGYKYQGNVCTDINECQLELHECKAAERCDNTIGSYHCSRITGCGTGYTLNVYNGLCEDDDECVLNRDNCKELGPNYKCRNIEGSFRCEIVRRKSVPTTRATTTRSTIKSTNESIPNSRVSGTIIPLGRVTTSTTMTTTTTAPSTTPKKPVVIYRPYPTPSGTLPYYSPKTIRTTPKTTPKTTPTTPKTTPTTPKTTPITPKTTPTTPKIAPTTPKTAPTTPKSFVHRPTYYPVISGQQKKCLPGYIINSRGECEDIDECENNPCGKFEKCVNLNGRYFCSAPMQCKMGFELNESGDQCIDVNECSRGTHRCQPTQICKNYHGFYSCECPPGHHQDAATNQCIDLDECKMYRPCRSSSSKCINTIGSFKCECKDGFYRKTANECSDIDECMQSPGLCEHNCVNIWGSYRCSCKQGFTLNYDNSTCTDIDECERFKDRKLCIGSCKNVPGSYTCECPPGYKLGSDGRVCIDIDECQQNACLADEVCLNTRGSFRCYRIICPPHYIKDTEHKSRCKRVCDSRDSQCRHLPEQYTYQYITLVSNLPLFNGHLNLFKMKGPAWYFSRAVFTMKLIDVNCPHGVERVREDFFRKSDDDFNSMSLLLMKSIQGPQEIKMQIEMTLFQENTIIGNAVVYFIIVVSEFPF